MTDPRAALEKLTVALERHLEAASARRDPDDPMVAAAAQDLAEAFDEYDEALFEATEVATPFVIYGEELDAVEDEDDESGPYAGLEAEEYDDDVDDDEDDFDDEDDEDDEDDDGAEEDEDDEDDVRSR